MITQAACESSLYGNLFPDHRKLLDNSAISPGVAAERGYRSIVTPEDWLACGFSDRQAKLGPALLIPLWTVWGEQKGFQARPDRPRTLLGKIVKYETPPRQRPVLDIHPAALRALRENPNREVLITEGSRKADAMASKGGVAIALSGVYNFRDREGALPDWESIQIRDHDFVVAYDSDVAVKSEVGEAMKRLGRFLEARGARSVKYLYLPSGPNGEKVGIDDFIAAGGTAEALQALIEPAVRPTPRADELKAFDRTDAGNAALFAHLFGPGLRYDRQRQRWLRWTPARHRWETVEDGSLTRDALTALRWRDERAFDLGDDERMAEKRWIERSRSAAGIRAMLELSRDFEPIDCSGVAWDARPELLACENGVVDLRTGTIRPGEPGDFLTAGCDLPFDPNAPAPRWTHFLAEVFEGKPEMISFIQRAAGYTATGEVTEQVLFLLHGAGANGKSTLLDMLRTVLGPALAGAPRFEAFEDGARGDAFRDRADLPGKRLAVVSETPEGRAFDAAGLKAWTGGEPVTTAKKYGQPFSFAPTAKLWFATNHLPRVRDDSEGFWRRMITIPFTASFMGANCDPRLKDKLLAERTGILAWIVAGARDWYTSGLGTPDEVLVNVSQYRATEDHVSAFIAERIVREAGAKLAAADAYAAYCQWAAENPDIEATEVLSKRAFGTRFAQTFSSGRSNASRFYLGARLNRDASDASTPVFANSSYARADEKKLVTVTQYTSQTELSWPLSIRPGERPGYAELIGEEIE